MSEHNLDYKNVECPQTQAAMGAVRAAFMVAEKEIADNCKKSREASIAFTKLEESLMWAIKSLAVHGHDLTVHGHEQPRELVLNESEEAPATDELLIEEDDTTPL